MIDTNAKPTSTGLPGVPRAQTRTFQRHRFLFHAGSTADACYLIRTGQVRCFLLDPDGRETTTALLGPGQFVGLTALLGRDAHDEFCEALTSVEAWCLPAGDLRGLSTTSTTLQEWLLASIARRLELTLAIYRGISLLSAPQRADDIQLRLRALCGVDPQAVRQTALAGLLQIRPETLTRARRPQRLLSPCATTVDEATIGFGRHEFGIRSAVVTGRLPVGSVGRVVSGRVELSVVATGGRAVVAETLGPGDIFGFASLLALPCVPFSLTGKSAGALDILPADQFSRRLTATTSELRQIVIRLADRLQGLEQALAQVAVPDVGRRLVHVLCQVACADGVAVSDRARTLPANWSHAALAGYLGVRRETVTRALAALARAGVITRQGRRVVLLSDRDWRVDVSAEASSDPRWAGAQVLPIPPAAIDRAPEAPTSDRHERSIVWLPTADIDEPSGARSSRGTTRGSSIQELAASLRQDGCPQPLSVRRNGERFELVFGVRRFRAAMQAGLPAVPCIVRDVEDHHAPLLNALESFQREHVPNTERVKTIERLATSGLGIREISRRTGFNPSTISRWRRIDGRPELKQALEDERIDMARAVILVDAPGPALSSLLAQAPTLSAAALRRQVAALKAATNQTSLSGRSFVEEALRCLRAVQVTVDEPRLIESIRVELERISACPPTGRANDDRLSGVVPEPDPSCPTHARAGGHLLRTQQRPVIPVKTL